MQTKDREIALLQQQLGGKEQQIQEMAETRKMVIIIHNAFLSSPLTAE